MSVRQAKVLFATVTQNRHQLLLLTFWLGTSVTEHFLFSFIRLAILIYVGAHCCIRGRAFRGGDRLAA